MVRQNRLRALLAEGRPLLGGHAFIPDPTYIEFMGHAGFDWIYIDAEHNGVSVTKCYELVRAADVVGMASFLRVPTRDVEPYLAYTDTGVHALKVPHLRNAQDAIDLRSALRFPPVGTRGISGNTRANNYGLTNSAVDFLTDTENAIIVSAMIEDVEAVDNLPEIIETGAIEIFSPGLSDLAGSMGHTGRPDHPEVQAKFQEVLATLTAANQKYVASTTTVEGAQKLFAQGAALVCVQMPKMLGKHLIDFAKASKS